MLYIKRLRLLLKLLSASALVLIVGCSSTHSLKVKEDEALGVAKEQLDSITSEIPSIYLVRVLPLAELEDDRFETLLLWIDYTVKRYNDNMAIHNGLVDLYEARRE